MWLTYEDLDAVERSLVQAVHDRRAFVPDPRAPGVVKAEPAAQEWGPDRTVRGALVRQILAAEAPRPPGAPPDHHAPLVHLQGVRITGAIDLRDTVVRSRAEFSGCWFEDESPPALEGAELRSTTFHGCWLPAGLDATHARLSGDLDMTASHVRGAVRLRGAQITGALILKGSDLDGGGGPALIADGAKVDGGMFATTGFRAVGSIRLLRTQIAGQVDLSGATPSSPRGDALVADGAQISGGLFAKTGFEADGEVRLPSAHIAGQLVLTGAKIRNPDSCALNADGIRVDGGLFARKGFESIGEVRLLQARVATQMDLTDASFHNPGGDALSLDGAQIVGDLFAAGGFEADGTIRLLRTQISGQLRLVDATLRSSSGTALDAEHLVVGRLVIWDPAEVAGNVHFTFASVGAWRDTARSRQFPIGLKGMRYDAIDSATARAEIGDRIAWLGRDPESYSPSAYTRLASVLRAGGQDGDARRVLMASERARYAHATRWRVGQAFVSAFLRWTVGYGYRQWLALVWLVGLVLLAGLSLFLLPGGAATSFVALEGAPQPFNPWVYTLDVVLPFLSVGYDRWIPEGWAQAITLGVVLVGWSLVTAVVSAFAGILRRGD